jgi:BirA family biotin operon repressor/biotin-[acetyl-CoA-carboxylase] ligase
MVDPADGSCDVPPRDAPAGLERMVLDAPAASAIAGHDASRPAWPTASLQACLRALEPGLALEVVAECGSTNTALVERARTWARGAPARLLVAEQQFQGRGRQGRPWTSARGASLTFSLALTLEPADWAGLSLAVGVALAEALEPAPVGRPGLCLKWPNDLWLRDDEPAVAPGRKLGGILIETVAGGGGRVCVTGVGLNLQPQPVAQAHSGFACLQELVPGQAEPALVLERVAPPLVAALRRFEREGFAPFAAAYAARDLLSGREVSTTLPGLPFGRAEGVDDRGALLLRDAQGTLHTVHAGEVSIRPHTGIRAGEGD